MPAGHRAAAGAVDRAGGWVGCVGRGPRGATLRPTCLPRWDPVIVPPFCALAIWHVPRPFPAAHGPPARLPQAHE